ncbi:MAG: iron-containing alcohol dehydrogenase [Ruminiclostridium sp.]|nr:iron-containing alcohol dehydrogenase [Ruminiclostridium sp.]
MEHSVSVCHYDLPHGAELIMISLAFARAFR